MSGASITSSGIYLPEKIFSNASLEDCLNFEPGFIEKTTGIKERRWSERHETVEYMASAAAVSAVKETATKRIDALFFCRDAVLTKRAYSLTPHVKKSLSEIGVDVKGAFSVDTVNGCTGYAPACNMASLMINAGQIENALVIASTKYNDLIVLEDNFNRRLNEYKRDGSEFNWLVSLSSANRGFQPPALNAFLWGCGAGAVLIEKNEENHILGSSTESNHRFPEDNFAMGDRDTTGESFCVLDWASIYKYAISEIPGFVKKSAEKIGLDLQKVKIVPHQPQPRMLDRLAEKINIPRENLMTSCDYLGNMIAASVPITYHLAKQQGKILPGQDVAFLSFGDSYLTSSLFAFKEAKK
jgi:3-oxoacyl-[acyl-carrier-protein] synthase III